MGEIADMMLDGTLCECCGTYIGDAEGYPRYCSDQCARDRGAEPKRAPAKAAPQNKVSCPTCGRRVKAAGLTDHQRDAHGVRA